MKKRTFVVIGNSASGLACIEAIRGIDKDSPIINISKEPCRPYSRCLLSYYLAGMIPKERLWIRKENYYKELNAQPLLDTEVLSIDEKERKLELSSKKTVTYDKLLIATGASSKKISVKGADKKGVFCLRTMEDADGILSMLKEVKSVVILGGGLIGMRAAYSLKKQHKDVHVVVKSSHIFSQMLDYESADMIKSILGHNGIEISTGLEAVEIAGGEKVEGVVLDDGNRLECQLVIIGKGVSPNIDLCKGRVKTNEGVLVDASLQTSDEAIYAAGDAAEGFDMLEEKNALNAIWPAAVKQGKVAGLRMVDKKVTYEGSCGMNSVEFFGLSAISFGIVRPKQEGYEELIQANFAKNIYRKVVLKNNRIVGGVCVNDVEKHGIILNLALQKIDISDIKDILLEEYFDYGKIIPLVKRQKESFKRPEYSDTVLTYDSVW
ncbi:MAG: FAD-dependent oxidoreductase [Candidatus Omnitrophota bacterium]